MRKISKLAVLSLGALAVISGCKDTSGDFYKAGKVNGYNSIASVKGGVRYMTMLASGGRDNGRLHAADLDNDGRFDSINLDLPKGQPLEAYTSLDNLEQAYNNIIGEQ